MYNANDALDTAMMMGIGEEMAEESQNTLVDEPLSQDEIMGDTRSYGWEPPEDFIDEAQGRRSTDPAPDTQTKAVQVYTAQYRYQGEDRFDITAGTKDPIGKIFAPSWDMVNAYKNGDMSREEYTSIFLGRVNQSQLDNPAAWDDILSRKQLTIVCFCPHHDHTCQRRQLASVLQGLGGKYRGERIL